MTSLFGIDVDGSPEYERQVVGVLKTVAGNAVGQVLLKALGGMDKNLAIVPYASWRADITGQCNSFAKPTDPRDAAPQGARGDSSLPWYKGKSDDLRTYERDERYDQLDWKAGSATGRGSDSRLDFSPAIFNGSRCGGGHYGSKADEVLCHEIVHVIRQMQGLSNRRPTTDRLGGYENEEEFLAVVVANVYLLAKGSRELRADHTGHTALRPPLDTSTGFLADKDVLRLMTLYRLVWTGTFMALAHIPAEAAVFNPFRQLADDLAYLGPVSE